MSARTLEKLDGVRADVWIRAATLEDMRAIHDLEKITDPDTPSVAELEERWQNWIPTNPRKDWVVEDAEGTVVANVRFRRWEFNAPGFFFGGIDVHPNFQGKGIGRRLLEIGEAWAKSRGGDKFNLMPKDDDERSIRFCEAAGYAKDRNLFKSALDLEKFVSAPIESAEAKAGAAGVEFVNYRDVERTDALDREIHRVYVASDTAPDNDVWGMTDYEEFKRYLKEDWRQASGIWLAYRGVEMVGLTMAGPEVGGGDWATDYTGTLPEHRRLGIGLALKVRSIMAAKTSGAKRLSTHNDSENVSMLAINTMLGFKREPGTYMMRKRLSVEEIF